MKKLLLLPVLSFFTIQGMVVPARSTESVRLVNSKHIYVEDDFAAYRIAPHNMNKELRTALQLKVLNKYKEAAAIRAHKQSDGTYTLYGKTRGLGGGPGGAAAGVIVGKALTYGVCYGGIWVASLLAGPASTPTAMVAGKVATPFIEIASNKVAIACGILGGILTGPA